MQVEWLDALTHSRRLYASGRGGQTTAFRVSGLYKRPTNNFQWEVGITRAHFQPQTQVRALLCVSADAFVIRICAFINAGDARGWGSERMVLTGEDVIFCSVLMLALRKCIFLFIPHWWGVWWTPAFHISLVTGAVCTDLSPFESCHVRLSDARERAKNGKAVGIKQPFVWIRGYIILRMGCWWSFFFPFSFFPWNKFLEGIIAYTWPSEHVHKGRI